MGIASWIICLLPVVAMLATMVAIAATKRDIFIQLMCTVMHVVVIVLSFIIARLCTPFFVHLVTKNPELSSAIADGLKGVVSVELLATFLEPLGIGLLSPIVFTVSIILFELILIAPSIVLASQIRKKEIQKNWNKNQIAWSKFGAIALSVVTALSFSTFSLTAITGTIRTTAQISKELSEDNALSVSEEAYTPVVFGMDAVSGWMYNGLTEVTLDGKTMSIGGDLPSAIPVLSECSVELTILLNGLFTSGESFLTTDLSAIGKIGDKIENSVPSKAIFSVVMNMLAQSAKDGKTIFGIDFSKDTDATTASLRVALVSAFSDTTSDTISQDLKTFYLASSTLQNTLKAIGGLQTGEDKEDVLISMEKIFAEMTPESAKLSAEIAAGSMETISELLGEDMEGITDMIVDVYVAMGNAKADPNVSDAQFRKEVLSFSELMAVSVDPTPDNIEGMVEAYLDSSVISSVVVEKVKKEGSMGLANYLADSTKDKLKQVIEDYRSNKNAEMLDALLKLFGLDK